MPLKLKTNQTQTQVLENRPLILYIMDISEKPHFLLFSFEEPFKHISSTRVASLFSWISHRGSTQARHPAGRSAVCLCCLSSCLRNVQSYSARARNIRTSAYNRICRDIISYSLHNFFVIVFSAYSLHTRQLIFHNICLVLNISRQTESVDNPRPKVLFLYIKLDIQYCVLPYYPKLIFLALHSGYNLSILYD